MCRLIVSEVVTSPCLTTRVETIEKWAAVADICRCLHNFNGVLQVCAAFTNSAVFRLKKTWERIGKTVISHKQQELAHVIVLFSRPTRLGSCRRWSAVTAATATWGTRSTGELPCGGGGCCLPVPNSVSAADISSDSLSGFSSVPYVSRLPRRSHLSGATLRCESPWLNVF